MTLPHKNLTTLIISCIIFNRLYAETQQCKSDNTCWWEQDLTHCQLVLGVKSNVNSGRKFGVYANIPLKPGMPLPLTKSEIDGDVVIQLIDVDNTTTQLHKWIMHGYLIDAVSSGYGGNYEGNGRVLSALPGMGMLASSFDAPAGNSEGGENTEMPKRGPNVWASIPSTDEANHPRRYSSLAGSFALNYNLTFHAVRPLSGGEEVMVDRSGWFRRNSLKSSQDTNYKLEHSQYVNGVCLDTMIYPSHAKNGRGAFASEPIPKGSIVAYSPVLPLPREELRYVRKKEKRKNDAFYRDQLLLNYCFGHENSSVLLFPYGSFVNYINHAPMVDNDGGNTTANVRVQWSEKLCQNNVIGDTEIDLRNMTPSELWGSSSPEGLVLEYVALRNIQPNDEILLDYGGAWSNSWEEHMKKWKADPLNKDGGPDAMSESKSLEYSPAYIMEDVVSNLRTAEEQLSFPYPKNIFTACFYRYEYTESINVVESSTKTLNEATPWKMTRGLFDMTNLRPCKVIARVQATDRHSDEQGGKNVYTAIIQNRPGLSDNERIPTDIKHIVSGIPREAFRFVDRPYSSDEHLDNAFRHNIALDAEIFPKAWLDL